MNLECADMILVLVSCKSRITVLRCLSSTFSAHREEIRQEWMLSPDSIVAKVDEMSKWDQTSSVGLSSGETTQSAVR